MEGIELHRQFNIEGALVRGRPAVRARDVGKALGYSDPAEFAKMIRDEWSGRFRQGTDYAVIEGEELSSFKAGIDTGGSTPPVEIPDRARKALVLFEEGVIIATLLSNKPNADPLRWYIVDVVLPQHKQTMARLLGEAQTRVLQLEDNEAKVKRKEEKAEAWVEGTRKGVELLKGRHQDELDAVLKERNHLEAQLNGIKAGFIKKRIKVQKTWES